MATSLRGSPASGKEKRGTSPSTSTLKKTSKTNSSSSLQSDEKSSLPTDSNKPVPNYLRPTISSGHDSSKQPKKPASETSSLKGNLNRRRSFERPPPSSQVQRAIRTPTTGSKDIKPVRSSSFSNKSSTSPASSSTRPTSERLYARTSSLKDRKVEPQGSNSRTVKKSTGSSLSPGSRKEPASSSTYYRKKAPKSVTSESSADNNEHRPSVDHLTMEDDLVNIDDQEVQSLPEMSEMPESTKELADPTNEVEEVKQSEEQGDEHIHEEESAYVDQVVEEITAVETEKTDHQTVEEESADEQPNVEVEGAEEQNLVDSTADQQPDDSDKMAGATETTVEETKEIEAEKTKEETEAKDEKQTVSAPPEESAPAKPVKTPQQPSSAGKKDKQAYNDVIEETATKLMGGGNQGRRNKVLALAGAFETVISLDSNTKS